jgi:sigma-B regulation protein RsbU (phosphoserine phosphatase)
MAEAEQVIVFVDDEANILSALRRELHGWAAKAGLGIATYSSAKEALAFLESDHSRVAILVSDLRMPEMKGSDLLLAAKARWPEIPTILLSGYSEAGELMKAVKAGIMSYILKPWDSDYLRAELDKALELRRVREENEAYARRVEEELRWAGAFQKTFLKPSLKSTEGIEAHATWRPVEGLYCGGDYYDVLNVGKRRYLALIGDVAGHGIKAAFVTGFLKTMIYTEYVGLSAGEGFSTSRFLEWLNNRVSFELRQSANLLVSFAALFLDLDAGTVRYANAGHCKPLILRDGRTLQLPVSGPALGFHSSVSYQEQLESLAPGDVLFLHTDGLVEVGSSSGREARAAIGDILRSVAYGEAYHARVMEACLAASGTSAFDDDVTILSIKIL